MKRLLVSPAHLFTTPHFIWLGKALPRGYCCILSIYNIPGPTLTKDAPERINQALRVPRPATVAGRAVVLSAG